MLVLSNEERIEALRQKLDVLKERRFMTEMSNERAYTDGSIRRIDDEITFTRAELRELESGFLTHDGNHVR